jgi:hypothetical protein
MDWSVHGVRMMAVDSHVCSLCRFMLLHCIRGWSLLVPNTQPDHASAALCSHVCEISGLVLLLTCFIACYYMPGSEWQLCTCCVAHPASRLAAGQVILACRLQSSVQHMSLHKTVSQCVCMHALQVAGACMVLFFSHVLEQCVCCGRQMC